MPIAPPPEPTLGQKIRQRRKVVGKTLQAIANETGLSIAFHSQVERDLSSPSLASLKLIADALGVGVETFVRTPEISGPVSRHQTRVSYSTGMNGPRYERLSDDFVGSMLNSVIINLPVGYRAQEAVHEGEELMYVLSGKILCTVNGEERLLEAGDSIHFASGLPHRTENLADIPARVLWVGTLRIFNKNVPTQSRGGPALDLADPVHDATGALSVTEGI